MSIPPSGQIQLQCRAKRCRIPPTGSSAFLYFYFFIIVPHKLQVATLSLYSCLKSSIRYTSTDKSSECEDSSLVLSYCLRLKCLWLTACARTYKITWKHSYNSGYSRYFKAFPWVCVTVNTHSNSSSWITSVKLTVYQRQKKNTPCIFHETGGFRMMALWTFPY